MNDDDRDQDDISEANCWIEAPVGYFDDIDWDLINFLVCDLTIWKLTIDEAVEVAAQFDGRRIAYDDRSLTLTIFGVPAGTGRRLDPWLNSRWPEKWG